MPHRFLPGAAVALMAFAAPALTAMSSAAAASPYAPTPYHDLQPEPSVVALAPGLEGDAFVETLNALEAAGIQVPVAYPGAGFILIDRGGVKREAANHGLTLLRDAGDAAGLGAIRSADPRMGGLLRWWEDGFHAPVLDPAERSAREAALAETDLCAGARDVGEVAGRSAACGPGEYGTVHFAAGRCVVNLIRPQQVGAVQYVWNNADVDKVAAELTRALMWWNLKTGRRLTFVLEDHGKVTSQVEPAVLNISQEGDYIGDCLTSLGYTTSTCPYTQLGELNATQRDRYRAHWGVTQFILNAEVFPGSGALAYAYLGGPHTVALRGNGSLSIEELDLVIAHEFGHIFQAVDEYA
ncbi:MAG: hypothetical protein HKN12_03775, partial [Gemmatimonadetes bacterium]|nr:hypothetical protein [Gemmatimonadota bacterium]